MGLPRRKVGALEKRYKEELRRLSQYWPAESITLEEAGRGRLRIRLQNGLTHAFSQEEVDRLLSLVPEFLWGSVRIPLLLRYEVIGSASRYRVLGGRWQMRLAEIMVRGSYSYEGLEELRVSEFQQVLRRYKSLVFVGLHV